ncbi:MAG: ABC transporter ATP-binding protein [Planctomycetota bacterium]|nr:MAG: ABC transporter ATP-binding protein [Planctomycetota bacterium]
MIEIEKLHLRQGDFRLSDVNLTIETGTYAVLMGKTGSGKTSLLEAVCGLRSIAGGSIRLHGREISSAKPGARGIGYVPQDGALFPTMTVEAQLAFPLRLRNWSRQRIRDRIEALAALLQIEPLLRRKPDRLSGGEKQRVALGRALSFEPSLLCLDEPMASLDEETKESLYQGLQQLRNQVAVTALHVTHSSGEALRLGDRIFRLEQGSVQTMAPEALQKITANGAGPKPPG